MDAAVGGVGRLPVRPHARRAPRSSRSTRRRRRSADRCTSATSFRSPTPTSSRAFSGCAARPCSIRWAGTTTACRPSAACRTTTACAAIRRCPTMPAFVPPAQPPKPPMSVSRPNFIELCDRLTRGRREGVRASVEDARPVGRLVDDLRDDRQARAARVAARVPAPAEARPGLSGRGADAVGRRFQDRGRAGRARRSRDAGRVSPHQVRSRRATAGDALRRDRDDAAGADSGLRRAGRASRRCALPAAVRQGGR